MQNELRPGILRWVPGRNELTGRGDYGTNTTPLIMFMPHA